MTKTELNSCLPLRSPALTIIIFLSTILHRPTDVNGQSLTDSTTFDSPVRKKRLKTLVIAGSATYAVSMAGLYQLWYKNSESQPFQFFNDNAEWKQVDKAGHFFSAFHVGSAAQRSLLWCGMNKHRADVTGALTGFLVLLPIEVFDGFSDAYGASGGDLVANAGGAAFFYAQQSLWNEIRIHPKVSYHQSPLASLRPEVFGDNAASRVFKDYNGQTYWLSFDMDKFIHFPSFLNFAVGYGAEDMFFARDYQNVENGYQPYRQFYVSLDVDLTAIRTNSKALRSIIYVLNMIRIPAPTVAFSKQRTAFKPLYF
jgi:hypothetical protein